MKEFYRWICLWSLLVSTRIMASDEPNLFWTHRMPGAVAEFRLSKNGHALVVATNPDSDIPGSAHEYLLSHYKIGEKKRDKRNKGALSVSQTKRKNHIRKADEFNPEKVRLAWQLPVRTSIRGLDVSNDGSLTVATTYENEILGVNSKGKLLWSLEGICKPIILNSSQRILCYHDDDAEPRIAFDLLDWKGKKQYSFPIENDILVLKVATNEQRIILGLENGKVLLLDQELKLLWTYTVAGEIVDLAISKEKNPEIAVLYRPKDSTSIPKGLGQKKVSQRQEILVLHPNAQPAGLGSLPFYSSQIEFSSQETLETAEKPNHFIYFYGNGSSGQSVGKLEIPRELSKKEKELWRYQEAHEAEYLSSFLVVPSPLTPLASLPEQPRSIEVIMGVEQTAQHTRESHLVAFEPEGKMRWDLKLPSDEGAYLNGLQGNSKTSLLAISTDDGKMNLVKLGSAQLPQD